MEKKVINSQEIEVRCQISDIRIEQRADDTESRTITGYAAKFDTWSQPIMGWFREQIRSGAFDDCDMSDAIMCFNHNIDDILARTSSQTLTLSVDNIGLKFCFDAPNTSRGNDVVEWIRRGDVNKCSFRFVVEKDEWLYADESNGNEFDERTIIKISKLFDCALVVYPAYKETEASIRSLEERKNTFLESRKKDVEGQTDDSQAVIASDCRKRFVEMLSVENK